MSSANVESEHKTLRISAKGLLRGSSHISGQVHHNLPINSDTCEWISRASATQNRRVLSFDSYPEGLAGIPGWDPPSMRRRHFFLIASLLLVAGALGTLLWLRHRALPEAVRLLPESDAVVFVNVKAIRRVADTNLSGVVHEPEYDEFIRETGIDFERD